MQYSVVDFKKVVELPEFRFDADYFKPEYLELDKIIKKTQTLEELCSTRDLQSNGAFKTIFEILNDNNPKIIPYIRSGNVGNFFITKNDLEFISLEAHNKLEKTQTKINDVLMARKGKIGGATIITPDCINFNSNDNVVNIRVKDKNHLNQTYLVAFLNSKYGIKQVERQATGNVQPWLSMYQVRNLKIIIKDFNFQLFIEKIVKEGYKTTCLSKENYQQTENILLKELGLNDWKPKHKLYWTTTMFSDTQQVERIDAEYFQPKFDEIIKAIKDYSNGWDNLSNIVSIKKCIEVGSDAYTEEGIPFLRVSNLSKLELNENNQQYISQDLYKELAENFQPKKGEILLSKDGTAGLAYHINSEPKKMIPCGGILRLKVKNKEYLPEYVTLVLNSLIVQEQIERVSSGALIKHWLIDQINNTVIPKLDINKQKEIVVKIQESFKCREQSKQLLEIAKLGVEKAIEENEKSATDWINQELEKLGVDL